MDSEDAREFGVIVNELVGRECERTLAVNSIKLRFQTEREPRGDYYIWIDPPWRLISNGVLVTSSADYDETAFLEWSRLLDPLNRVQFIGWSNKSTETIFTFANGHSLVVPVTRRARKADDWYTKWYAQINDRVRRNTD
jgi:hypothetical protein